MDEDSRGVLNTLPASGADATLPATGGDTMAASPESVTGARSVTVRAGRAEDYEELQPIDPGHFVVGKEIARGGMGRILSARDRRLGRTVAIKELLKSSSALRARFEREARITAKLQHPAIVNILEAGAWPGGEPFYVMKLVTGESLDKVIARCTTLDQRLGLLPTMIAVVDALAYAHSKQVIHRDLKPGNVLVGEFGETVVIDWGLAKDLSERDGDDAAVRALPSMPAEADATIVGAVLGTPAYMPVEQARGEIVDARADVYALGAILYHVLAGAPPVVGTSIEDTLRRAREEVPISLGSRAPNVPPDLVTIVEKAMARAAEDRYPSAAELAADLKKFQTGKLVGAHHYTAWQLITRWARAHRAAIGVGVVALAVVGVLGAVSLRRIFVEQAESERLGKLAEQRRGEAEELLSFLLGDLRAKLQPLGKLDLLKDVAVKATAYFDQRGEALSDADLAKRALVQRQLGEVLLGQGDSDGAERAFREAMTIAQGLIAKDPQNVARQFDVMASQRRIGAILAVRGDAAAALGMFRACGASGEALVVKDPGNVELRRTLVQCASNIGRVLTSQGDTSGALAAFRAALTAQTPLATTDPETGERDLFQIRIKIGETLSRQGDAAGALAEYRASLAGVEKLVAKDPTNATWQGDLANSHQKVGDVLSEQGDSAGALARFRAALEIYERLAERDPSDAFKLADVSGVAAQIGEVLMERGDAAGATAAFRRTLATSQALADRDPGNSDRKWALAFSHEKVGDGLRALRDRAGALRSYETALALALELVADDPTNVEKQRTLTAARENVGDLQLAAGNVQGALAQYRAASDLTREIAGRDPTNIDNQRAVAVRETKLADAEIATGKLEEGIAGYRAALATFEALEKREPSSAVRQTDLVAVHHKLGELLVKRGDLSAALIELRASLAAATRVAAIDPENLEWLGSLGEAHERLGDALLAQRDRAGAVAEYEAARAVMAQILAKEPSRPGIAEDAAKLARKAARR